MLQNSISHYATSPSFKTTVSNNQKNNSSTRLSNPSLVFDSINHFNLTESFKVNKDFLICSKISFVSEDQWLEAAFCQICTINFDKFKANFRHHCRICGSSVCGVCSSKKVNEKRSCDLCFLRIECQEMTARKEKMLNLKEDSIKDLEVEIKVTKDKLNKVFDEIQFFNSKNLIEKKEEMQKRMDLQKKLNESKEIFLKVSETNKNTKENMIKILEEKDNKVEQLKKSWNLKKELSADNERKMFFMHNKVEELENLINHIAKTRKTKSYAEIYELLEIEDMINFQIETSSKSEIIDDESPSFVNKIRKSLAKSSKKSLMMMNSLLKGSIMDKKKSEKKKYGFTPYGICCGSTLCSIFDSI